MLYAFVLACVLGRPDMCVEAVDERGPYKTQKECEARVDEMVAALVYTLPPVPHEFKFKCVSKGTPT